MCSCDNLPTTSLLPPSHPDLVRRMSPPPELPSLSRHSLTPSLTLSDPSPHPPVALPAPSSLPAPFLLPPPARFPPSLSLASSPFSSLLHFPASPAFSSSLSSEASERDGEEVEEEEEEDEVEEEEEDEEEEEWGGDGGSYGESMGTASMDSDANRSNEDAVCDMDLMHSDRPHMARRTTVLTFQK
ncbi:unnamed protein product [Closterium sp. Naga37s-1]|nr:unnamed protein product [Closterium sp. Naga37s-1]